MTNRESQTQFENRIKPRVYVRHVMRSTMFRKEHFISRNWRKENNIQSYENPLFDYPKRFINRLINEVYDFSIKYRYSAKAIFY